MSLEEKRNREKELLNEMIKLYCKKNHHSNELCPCCKEVFNYACNAINRCPFMATKTFCSSCKSHCYKPEMRQKIRQIMRFSGCRMLFRHPIILIRHILDNRKVKAHD